MSEAKKRRAPHPQIQNVFVFLLLAVFAMSAIFLTALGAQIYRGIVDTSTRNNNERIVTAIIRGAAQGEDAGIASIKMEGGVPVLTFTNDYDGDIYLRRLYCFDGFLRESFTSAEREFELDMGDSICPVDAFEPEINGNLLTAKVVIPQVGERTVSVWPTAGGAAQ